LETKHPGVGPVMVCRLPPSGYTGQSLRPHLRRKVSGRVSPVAVDRDCTVLYRSAAALMAGLTQGGKATVPSSISATR